jgi:DNA processing protein
MERAFAATPYPQLSGLLALDNEALASAAAPKVAEQLLARAAGLSERQLQSELRLADCWATCRHHDLYPEALREAADAPWALIARGNPRSLEGHDTKRSATVVGARRATTYGREVARRLGRELAEAGVLTLSGLAFGIDSCAHRGALDAGGETIAVLGCGPDIAYPAAHRSLWRRITEQGLILSELPPGATPWRWSFPARNRILAALGGITIVVEAEARSGSLVTADVAARLGHRLGAVPGPVNSRASVGPNELLASGAHLVRGGQDVLAALRGLAAQPVPPPNGEAI